MARMKSWLLGEAVDECSQNSSQGVWRGALGRGKNDFWGSRVFFIKFRLSPSENSIIAAQDQNVVLPSLPVCIYHFLPTQ